MKKKELNDISVDLNVVQTIIKSLPNKYSEDHNGYSYTICRRRFLLNKSISICKSFGVPIVYAGLWVLQNVTRGAAISKR